MDSDSTYRNSRFRETVQILKDSVNDLATYQCKLNMCLAAHFLPSMLEALKFNEIDSVVHSSIVKPSMTRFYPIKVIPYLFAPTPEKIPSSQLVLIIHKFPMFSQPE